MSEQSPVEPGPELSEEALAAYRQRVEVCLWWVIEAMAAAADRCGLPAAVADELVGQTVRGAAALMSRPGADPARLRLQITSPGGTTERAMEVLARHRTAAALTDAALGRGDGGS